MIRECIFLRFWRPANQAPATRTVPSTFLLCVCVDVCVCAQCACVSVHISPQPRTCKFLHFVMQYHQNIGVLAGWKRPVLHAGQCDTLCVSTFCTYQAPSSQYQRSGVATQKRLRTHIPTTLTSIIYYLHHTCIKSMQM